MNGPGTSTTWALRLRVAVLLGLIWFLWILFSGRDINPFNVTIIYGGF